MTAPQVARRHGPTENFRFAFKYVAPVLKKIVTVLKESRNGSPVLIIASLPRSKTDNNQDSSSHGAMTIIKQR